MNAGTMSKKEPLPVQPQESAGFARTLRTVFFGLLGVAANRGEIADGKTPLSPLRIVVVAVIFMIIFVGSLITLASKIAAG